MSILIKKLFFAVQIALFSLGLLFTGIGILGQFNWKEIPLNIGITFIAASLISLFNRFFLVDNSGEKELEIIKQADSPVKADMENDNLGIVKIYENRSEINDKINNAIKGSATQIDVITQDGLYLIRKKSTIDKTIKNRLLNNLRMRILVPLKIREDYFETNINGLIEWWRNELNETQKANCKIHYYDGTPQDLFFHIDKMIFVGPFFYYLPDDQTTITYEFKENSIGGEIYTELFDHIWDESKEISIKNGEKK